METNKRILTIWPVLSTLLHSVASAACFVDGNQIVCNDPLIAVTPEPRWGGFLVVAILGIGFWIHRRTGKRIE